MLFFFFNDTATTEIYTTANTLSLHDALPISGAASASPSGRAPVPQSRMKTWPASVRTSTHEVLPPKRTVCGPGVAIDPRVPQNRTSMSGDAVDPPHVLPEHLSLDRRIDPVELRLDRLLRERPRPVAMRVVGAPHDVVGRDRGHRPHAVEVLLEGRVHLAREVGARCTRPSRRTST